jgi:hypothetical protein
MDSSGCRIEGLCRNAILSRQAKNLFLLTDRDDSILRGVDPGAKRRAQNDLECKSGITAPSSNPAWRFEYLPIDVINGRIYLKDR